MSLFSGIGGLDLAAEWAGFKTVGQCEFADYLTRALENTGRRPEMRDIRTLTGEKFYGAKQVEGQLMLFPSDLPAFSVAEAKRQEG